MTDTMTEITCTASAPPTASVFTQTVLRSQPPVPHKSFAPFGVQLAGTTLPSLAVLAEELRRLHLLCEAQARRLDQLEAHEHVSWPTRSAYAHLEIDP
jgi:hypothetical protein